MYRLANDKLEQRNMILEGSNKPGIYNYIHWLNPLLHRCRERLYPG